MTPTAYVSQDHIDQARAAEQRFRDLHPNAGVIFASVTPIPLTGGKTQVWRVVVGIRRSLSPETLAMVVRSVLSAEIEAGIALDLSVVPGVSCPA